MEYFVDFLQKQVFSLVGPKKLNALERLTPAMLHEAPEMLHKTLAMLNLTLQTDGENAKIDRNETN